MCYISVRPERHSYDIIKKNGEFVINLTNEEMAYATDWCGVKSGKDFNKFAEMKLTTCERLKRYRCLSSGIAAVHRMQGKGNCKTGFARYVYC
jgi:flavin reductase (DIM6/NTAB) family NADH-FMN oxidoreductase RutF